MADWPSTLPAPAINTFKEVPPDNLIRSSMDKGPDKVRRRTTANISPVSFSLKLTSTQVQTLDDFYRTTINSGADEFTYTHPRTGLSVTARFIEPPQYREIAGVLYEVPIQLEIMP